jgi:predicted nucleic acid-binding protein
MIYALDTNIIIHYLKNTPSVHQNFNSAIMRDDDLVIPKHFRNINGLIIENWVE